MLSIKVPGFADLKLEHAVFDYNGTLAVSGLLIPNIAAQINALANEVEVHILTADIFGTVKEELLGINCKITILPVENQELSKAKYIEKLNPATVVAIGNGYNDVYMLKKSRLSIAVIGEECLSRKAMESADVIVPSIHRALNLLNEPRKLIATLRK